MRMARGRPQKVTQYEVEDILQQMEKTIPSGTTQCFHNKPFMYPLYDLDDVPLSQVDSICDSQEDLVGC